MIGVLLQLGDLDERRLLDFVERNSEEMVSSSTVGSNGTSCIMAHGMVLQQSVSLLYSFCFWFNRREWIVVTIWSSLYSFVRLWGMISRKRPIVFKCCHPITCSGVMVTVAKDGQLRVENKNMNPTTDC